MEYICVNPDCTKVGYYFSNPRHLWECPIQKHYDTPRNVAPCRLQLCTGVASRQVSRVQLKPARYKVQQPVLQQGGASNAGEAG